MSLKYPKGMVPGDVIVDLFDRTKNFGQPNDIAVFANNSNDVELNDAIKRLTEFALAGPGEKTELELNKALLTVPPVMEFMIRVSWIEPEPHVIEFRMTEVQVISLIMGFTELFKSSDAMIAMGSYAFSLMQLLYPIDSKVQAVD